MKKAVIQLGGKQYIVEQDQILDVELIGDEKSINLKPLLVFDEDKSLVDVGAPHVEKSSVKAKLIDQVKGDKVTSIRFKAKKRVSKQHGHRQSYSRIQITSIT